MAGWWLCSVMTSHVSVRVHTVGRQRNRPGPSITIAEGSASAPRACQGARRHVRQIGGTISRRFENCQLLLRRHSVIGTRATNNCGQMVFDVGQVRASTRRSARCIWLHQVPVGGRRAVQEWLSETHVLDSHKHD